MMKEQDYYLLTFANTHAAMMAEGILKDLFEITIIPTLREISAGCGISISVKTSDIENALKQLKTAKFDETLMDIYRVRHIGGKVCPEPVRSK